ncbi:MAG: hypothetical protein ABIJ97_16050 [Bacteroidota bacterium]
MKKTLILAIILPLLTFGQNASLFNTGASFIENKGQFDGRNWQKSQIEYCIDYNNSNPRKDCNK